MLSLEDIVKRLENLDEKVDDIYHILLKQARREGVIAGGIAVLVSVGIALLTKFVN